MSGRAADLLRPRQLEDRDEDLPALMAAEVHNTTPLRVTVSALDNRRYAHRAAGTYPTAVRGDRVWVMVDDEGELVVVAWKPA